MNTGKEHHGNDRGNLISALWSDNSWSGLRLGRYTIVDIIGSGGMGRVFLATDSVLQREVAIKVMPEDLHRARETGRLQQFLRETRVTANLDHPNILAVYDVIEQDGVVGFAMEYLRGKSLQALFDAGDIPPFGELCRIVAEAADGLGCAHEHGLVHRDVKPANLVLDEQGRCKIVDFGATLIQEQNDLSMLGEKIIGTPQFTAPEVILHKGARPESDIYGLGMVLWWMITGTPPFAARTTKELYLKQVGEQLPDIARIRPDVPDSLKAVIEKCLEKAPEHRFRSCRELAEELRSIRRDLKNHAHSGLSDVSAAAGGTRRPRSKGALRAGSRSPRRRAAFRTPSSARQIVVVGGLIAGVALLFLIGVITINQIESDARTGPYRSGLTADQGRETATENESRDAGGDTPGAADSPDSDISLASPGTDAGGASGDPLFSSGSAESGIYLNDTGTRDTSATAGESPIDEMNTEPGEGDRRRSPTAGCAVTGFVLVDAETNRDIGPLKDGDTIALSETGTVLNIRAEVSGTIGSVIFSGVNDLTENVPPYAAWGNDGPDYYAKWQVTPGEYELRALPCTREKGRGKKGAEAVLRFTVVE